MRPSVAAFVLVSCCLFLSLLIERPVEGRRLELGVTFNRYIVCFKSIVPRDVMDLIAAGFQAVYENPVNVTSNPNASNWRKPGADTPDGPLEYNRIRFNYTLSYFQGWAMDVPVSDIPTNNAFRALAGLPPMQSEGRGPLKKCKSLRDSAKVVKPASDGEDPELLWEPPGAPKDAPSSAEDLALIESIRLSKSPAFAKQMFIEKSSTLIRLVEVSQSVPMSILQTGATWNLNRICQRDLLLDGNYYYNAAAGLGIDCYILDSGVNADHTEFQGRAILFADFTGDGFQDVLGHGTHVSGIIGGKIYGVAKKASIVGIRVIYDNGVTDYGTLIAALGWVADHAAETGTPSLINLSLAGPVSEACNSVIDGIVAGGVPVVAAAGNNGGDACDYSPASAASALTIAATISNDTRLLLPPTNTGSCVDMFAPGGSVLSAFIGSTSALAFMSGTSMAAPHVVGCLAITWSAMPTLTAAGLISRMLSRVSVGYLMGIPAGTANSLIYGARYV